MWHCLQSPDHRPAIITCLACLFVVFRMTTMTISLVLIEMDYTVCSPPSLEGFYIAGIAHSLLACEKSRLV